MSNIMIHCEKMMHHCGGYTYHRMSHDNTAQVNCTRRRYYPRIPREGHWLET